MKLVIEIDLDVIAGDKEAVATSMLPQLAKMLMNFPDDDLRMVADNGRGKMTHLLAQGTSMREGADPTALVLHVEVTDAPMPTQRITVDTCADTQVLQARHKVEGNNDAKH